ncbi:hypothetical protein D7X48_06100 [bacterium D16-50]|nr:hypothetical protein D7X48_06095 [bacterium D16-50]RKJ21089.1 hypothetical protein D7X48_06100 [bacterium D16-50]
MERKAPGRISGRKKMRPETLPEEGRLKRKDGTGKESWNGKRPEGFPDARRCGRKPFPRKGA